MKRRRMLGAPLTRSKFSGENKTTLSLPTYEDSFFCSRWFKEALFPACLSNNSRVKCEPWRWTCPVTLLKFCPHLINS